MICYLEGVIHRLNSREVSVSVNGIGYLVQIGKNFLAKIPPSEKLSLAIHTHVTEGEITLYGFPDHNAREVFLLLIRVSGIGPRIALSVVDASKPEQILEAILSKNFLFFSAFSGIGEKTAKKIIFELENKVSSFELSTDRPDSHPLEGFSDSFEQKKDLISALTNLGYGAKEAQNAIVKTFIPEKPFDQNLKLALREFKK